MDLLDSTIVAQRRTVFSVLFNDPPASWAVDQFVQNGGFITQANAIGVELHTGIGAAGASKLHTRESAPHDPNAEVGYTFAFRISMPFAGGAYARVGAADPQWADGVWIGYEGANFGISYSRGGRLEPVITQDKWLDPCNGSPGSLYRLNNQAVALDPTRTQLCRIRTHLGHRGFVVELKSPDGAWVKAVDFTAVNVSVPDAFTFGYPITAEVRRVSGEPVDLSLYVSDLVGYLTTPEATSVANVSGTGLASENTLQEVRDRIGVDGANAPANPGSGIRGWLRGIFERLGGTIKVQVENFPAPQALASNVNVVNQPTVNLSQQTLTALAPQATPSTVDLGQNTLNVLSPLVPTAYDSIQLIYTGRNVTQARYFKAGVLVTTLNLTYSANALVAVSRS